MMQIPSIKAIPNGIPLLTESENKPIIPEIANPDAITTIAFPIIVVYAFLSQSFTFFV